MLGLGLGSLAIGSRPKPRRGTLARPIGYFLDMVRINTHVIYTDSTYVAPKTVVDHMAQAGLTITRDAAIDSDNQGQASYGALHDAGIKFDFLLKRKSSEAALQTLIDQTASWLSAWPDGAVAIEGPNEINNTPVTFNALTGEAGGQAYMDALQVILLADPTLDALSLYNLTGAFTINDPFDLPNVHVYPHAGEQPLSWIRSALAAHADPRSRRFVATEFGYHTLVGAPVTNAWEGVDETRQAILTINGLLDFHRLGFEAVYLYQLEDAYTDADPPTNQEKHFGLFKTDGSAKPLATALGAIRQIAGHGGPAAPRRLIYSVSGHDGETLLFQRPDGVFLLALWREPQIWDSAAHEAVDPSSVDVVIEFEETPDSVEVYDPVTDGATPTAATITDNAVTITQGAAPLLVEVKPAGWAAPTVSSAVADILGSNLIAEIAADSVDDWTFNGLKVATAPSLVGDLTFAQATAARQPILGTVAGKPALVWPEGDIYRSLDPDAAFQFGWVGIVAQYKDGVDQAFDDYNALISDGGTSHRIVGTSGGSDLFATAWASTAIRNGAPASATVLPLPRSLLEFTGTPTSASWGIGKQNGSIGARNWQGTINHVMFCTAAPSAAELIALRAHLAARWGLTIA